MAASSCSRPGIDNGSAPIIATPPAFAPFKGGPAPDLPASSDGFVPAAFFRYPHDLVHSVSQPPLQGGEVRAFCMCNNPPAPPPPTNTAWGEVNRRLGGKLQIFTASYTDYTAKFGTLLASGDLPDLLFLHDTHNFPRQTEMLRYLCADLGPFVQGEGVRRWPNLATLPGYMWRNGLVNGVQYGIPNGQGGAWWLWMLANQSHLDQGGTATPQNADDFRRLLLSLTGKNRWGLVANNAFAPGLPFANMMWRAPKNWREDNGRLIKDIETPEYQEAVAYCRDLWAAGVVYPEMTSEAQALDQFYSGRASMYHVTVGATRTVWERLALTAPDVKLTAITPCGHDGGRGVYHYTNGSYGKVVLKKAPVERVKALLGLMDFLAAPFGSVEYQVLRYGVQGSDFDYDAGGVPRVTRSGAVDLNAPFRYLMSGYDSIYSAVKSEAFARAYQGWLQEHSQIAIMDPTVGLASRTYGSKGSALDQFIRDEMRNIVVGRSPMSAYAQVVADWRADGGDQVRAELERALAAAAA